MAHRKHLAEFVVSALILFSVRSGAQVRPFEPTPVSSLRTIQNVLASPAGEIQEVKCPTGFILWTLLQETRLTAQQRSEVQRVLVRPSMQRNRTSPSGAFRIHYDTTGLHVPSLLDSSVPPNAIPNSYEAYVDSVSTLFDYCRAFEIDTLGYGEQPSDGSRGGGPEYDIYIMELEPFYFGYTTPEDIIATTPNERYTSYIHIDNDYRIVRTKGMNGLKVTAAHEFHHAIQLGAYGVWSDGDLYFNELTSSWIEDVVFTEVNDYYYDVSLFFRQFKDSQKRSFPFNFFSMSSFLGYERSVWGHFLARRFGRNVMLEIWEGQKTQRIFPSMRQVLASHGTSLESEYALFNYWNYFTGDRADTVKYYPEGKAYPRFEPNGTASFSGSTSVLLNEAFPFSGQFYEVSVGTDTITAIVTNNDADAVERSDGSLRRVELRFTVGIPSGPYHVLSNGIRVSLVVAAPDLWRSFYLSSSSKSDIPFAQLSPSPNPLRLSESPNLALPVDEPVATEAEVFVLSSSLDLVFSDRFRVTESFGNRFVLVPSKNIQSKVATGIYFVVAKVAATEYRWKVAIIQ